MKYQLILVDDHKLVAEGISTLIGQLEDFELIAQYNDAREALNKVPLLKPDLLITDLDMPYLNGLELISQLKQDNSQLKFVLLTMHLDRATVKQCIKLGVEGYILKNAQASEFQHCLQTIQAGHSYYTPQAMQSLVDKASEIKATALKKTQLLSARELEILVLVAKGLSTKEISDALHIAVRTTETHRKAIMQKLEVSNVAGMVRIAVQEGLLG